MYQSTESSPGLDWLYKLCSQCYEKGCTEMRKDRMRVPKWDFPWLEDSEGKISARKGVRPNRQRQGRQRWWDSSQMMLMPLVELQSEAQDSRLALWIPCGSHRTDSSLGASSFEAMNTQVLTQISGNSYVSFVGARQWITILYLLFTYISVIESIIFCLETPKHN